MKKKISKKFVGTLTVFIVLGITGTTIASEQTDETEHNSIHEDRTPMRTILKMLQGESGLESSEEAYESPTLRRNICGKRYGFSNLTEEEKDGILSKVSKLFGIDIPTYRLTEDQRNEILSRVNTLKEQGVSLEEIRTEIQCMLQEYGIEVPDEPEVNAMLLKKTHDSNIGELVKEINKKFNWAKKHEVRDNELWRV